MWLQVSEATLVRTELGTTEVKLVVANLRSGSIYPAYMHSMPCEADETGAGPRYVRDSACIGFEGSTGCEYDQDNDVRVTLSVGQTTSAAATTTIVDELLRADAMTIVLRDCLDTNGDPDPTGQCLGGEPALVCIDMMNEIPQVASSSSTSEMLIFTTTAAQPTTAPARTCDTHSCPAGFEDAFGPGHVCVNLKANGNCRNTECCNRLTTITNTFTTTTQTITTETDTATTTTQTETTQTQTETETTATVTSVTATVIPPATTTGQPTPAPTPAPTPTAGPTTVSPFIFTKKKTEDPSRKPETGSPPTSAKPIASTAPVATQSDSPEFRLTVTTTIPTTVVTSAVTTITTLLSGGKGGAVDRDPDSSDGPLFGKGKGGKGSDERGGEFAIKNPCGVVHYHLDSMSRSGKSAKSAKSEKLGKADKGSKKGDSSSSSSPKKGKGSAKRHRKVQLDFEDLGSHGLCCLDSRGPNDNLMFLMSGARKPAVFRSTFLAIMAGISGAALVSSAVILYIRRKFDGAPHAHYAGVAAAKDTSSSGKSQYALPPHSGFSETISMNAL
jgi:hypothetical protein